MSTTIAAIAVMMGGTVLANFGFSEGCSNEIVAIAPTLVVGVYLWIKRVKQGDVSWLGTRKHV